MEYVISGKGAMLIQGDWVDGWMDSKGGYPQIGRGPTPGTSTVFVAVSDTFGLPKGAPHRDNIIAWLKVIGSKKGQELFNPRKGSIPARIDCDSSLFNDYLASAMEDWKTHDIVPSVVHGAAASESWATEYKNIINLFVNSGDVAGTQQALQDAADEQLE